MIIPIRDIAQSGIITDVDLPNLSLNSMTTGLNCRFEGGHIERGPVVRAAGPLPKAPKHVVSYEDLSGGTIVISYGVDGTVCDWSTSRVTDLTPAGHTPSTTAAVVTSSVSNGVVYICKEDSVPLYRPKNAITGFKRLDTYDSGNTGQQFPSSVRFKALRSTSGFLVGINVTDNGINIPTKVKWSTLATDFGVPPADWDVGGILVNGKASQGGENILQDMTGSLVDGLSLLSSMVLYGTRECWLMSFVGGNDIFDFRRLFDSGVLNVNCVTEYDGKHFVFGSDDIYVHDGTGNKKSIAAGRVRKYIFQSMIKSESTQAFCVHNRALTEIMFCYVSADSNCAFPYAPNGPRGCNRAAVYNLEADNWYFYDLPYVVSATTGPSAAQTSWDAETSSWAATGGSWSSEDVKPTLLIASPATNSGGPQIRSFASPDDPSASGNIDTAANGPVLIRKDQMDLDELKNPNNPYASLRGNKQVRGIIIQCDIKSSSRPIYVRVGSSPNISIGTDWKDAQTYDAANDTIDCNEQGKLLGIEFRYDDFKAFRLTGFDLDINILGAR